MTVEGYFGTMAETTSNYSRDFPRRVVGKNRNNSNNKQLSNLKETEWKLEKAYYIVSGSNDKNKPTSAYSVYVIVIVINYSIY